MIISDRAVAHLSMGKDSDHGAAGFDTYKLLSIMRITNLGALFVCAAPHTSFASVSDLIE
jgi:hypothetical protein